MATSEESGLSPELLNTLAALPSFDDFVKQEAPIEGPRGAVVSPLDEALARARPARTSRVTREELRQLFGLSRLDAAERLGIGLSSLKRYCAALGISRWPHRKLVSLKALYDYQVDHPLAGSEEQQALLAAIQREINAVYANPDHEIAPEIESRRLAKYKRTNLNARALRQQDSLAAADTAGSSADGQLSSSATGPAHIKTEAEPGGHPGALGPLAAPTAQGVPQDTHGCQQHATRHAPVHVKTEPKTFAGDGEVYISYSRATKRSSVWLNNMCGVGQGHEAAGQASAQVVESLPAPLAGPRRDAQANGSRWAGVPGPLEPGSGLGMAAMSVRCGDPGLWQHSGDTTDNSHQAEETPCSTLDLLHPAPPQQIQWQASAAQAHSAPLFAPHRADFQPVQARCGRAQTLGLSLTGRTRHQSSARPLFQPWPEPVAGTAGTSTGAGFMLSPRYRSLASAGGGSAVGSSGGAGLRMSGLPGLSQLSVHGVMQGSAPVSAPSGLLMSPGRYTIGVKQEPVDSLGSPGVVGGLICRPQQQSYAIAGRNDVCMVPVSDTSRGAHTSAPATAWAAQPTCACPQGRQCQCTLVTHPFSGPLSDTSGVFPLSALAAPLSSPLAPRVSAWGREPWLPAASVQAPISNTSFDPTNTTIGTPNVLLSAPASNSFGAACEPLDGFPLQPWQRGSAGEDYLMADDVPLVHTGPSNDLFGAYEPTEQSQPLWELIGK